MIRRPPRSTLFPTRRSSDLSAQLAHEIADIAARSQGYLSLDDLEEARQKLTLLYINAGYINSGAILPDQNFRSEEHTSELQSHVNLVCRLLLEKKKTIQSSN